VKIAFLDDHLLFAESMALAVLHKFPEATVSCFSSWSELEPALNAEGFDLVFLDMRLEDCLGAELVPRIREVYPTTRIAIVSAFASRDQMPEPGDLWLHQQNQPNRSADQRDW
jgi:DNA-binding NarL/FixJ family response regulator